MNTLGKHPWVDEQPLNQKKGKNIKIWLWREVNSRKLIKIIEQNKASQFLLKNNELHILWHQFDQLV